MKKTILSIAVIAAAIFAVSCQKESLQENSANKGSASVFTATIETGASTKTTVERVTSPSVAYKTYWESTDQISINGVTYTATPDDTDATKATFAKVPDTQTDPTGTFKAYFPKELCKKVKGLIISLPATYTYAEDKYNMPMYAESTTTSLSFKNLCGVLAITVKGTDFTSVSSIEVSSDQQMNGLFTADADGELSFASVTLTDALRKVTLTFASPKTIESTGSATFYIPVPPATNHTLTIKVTDGSTTKTMVTKKSGGVAVARNTVYPITFADNAAPATKGTAKRTGNIDVNWVQLWENGPKFAEYNVGAENNKAEDYGGYYCWGKTTDKDATSTYDTGTDALSGNRDTATNLWGSNWRMPTKAEFDALLANCTVEWTTVGGVSGRKFTGNTEPYTSNSVFLPAAGYCDSGSVDWQDFFGYFWSSTPFGSSYAYCLYIGSSTQDVGYPDRRNGYSVRAVLAE